MKSRCGRIEKVTNPLLFCGDEQKMRVLAGKEEDVKE
jgi:hypothetical protein